MKHKVVVYVQIRILFSFVLVPDMRVRGQLTCLEVKKENKKRDCKLCMYRCINSASDRLGS